MREPEGIAAVAAAAGHQLLAIDKGVRHIGIAAAVIGGGVVDIAAAIEAGFARRAERTAAFGRAHAGMRLYREKAAVAGAHAEGFGRALVSARRRSCCGGGCKVVGQAGEGIDERQIGRRPRRRFAGAARPAEQAVEKPRRGRLPARQKSRGEADKAKGNANYRFLAIRHRTPASPHATHRYGGRHFNAGAGRKLRPPPVFAKARGKRSEVNGWLQVGEPAARRWAGQHHGAPFY